MEEVKNMTRAEVINIGNDFMVRPRFSDVIITCNTEIEDGQLQLSSNAMSEFQYVVAKGPHVHDLEVGDRVQIDLDRMVVKIPNPNDVYEQIEQVKINPVFVDGNMFHRGSDKIIVAIYNHSENE